MNRNDLLGSWEMVSFQGKNAHDEHFCPFGENPVGQLIYTEQGHMSVFMSKKNRPAMTTLTKNELLNKTDDVLQSILEDFNSYAGRFIFDEEKQLVKHEITVAYFSEWVGTTQERYCEIPNNNFLLLKTPKITLEFKEEKEWWFEILWSRLCS